MAARTDLPSPADHRLVRAQRLFGRWWRRQSPTQQDRLATMAPLISVLLFLAAIIAAFWYLRNEEIEREADAVQRDTEIAQQQMRLVLADDQEQLLRLARDLASRTIDARSFPQAAGDFARERPAITHLSWLTPNRGLRATHASATFHPEVNPSGDAVDGLLDRLDDLALDGLGRGPGVLHLHPGTGEADVGHLLHAELAVGEDAQHAQRHHHHGGEHRVVDRHAGDPHD